MRPDSPQWISAKSAGDRAELAVANWFRERGHCVFHTIEPARFDLLVQFRVEVKRDLLAAKTGNVAIEVKHNGQPSGIVTSNASYWAILLEGDLVIIRTESLRAAVSRGRFSERHAGDNRASTVCLIPIEKLKSIKGAQVVSLEKTQPAENDLNPPGILRESGKD